MPCNAQAMFSELPQGDYSFAARLAGTATALEQQAASNFSIFRQAPSLQVLPISRSKQRCHVAASRHACLCRILYACQECWAAADSYPLLQAVVACHDLITEVPSGMDMSPPHHTCASLDSKD